MRLGDLDALKETINNVVDEEIGIDEKWAKGLKYSLKIIDNAPTVDFEKLGKSLNCQIRASYGSCDDCELSCPRNELIKLLGLKRPKGEWLHKEIDPFLKEYGQCSNCLQRERVGNFCRNCGADMRGKEE